MPELREMFEMTTEQIEPDQDSWRDQKERQHGARRNRRLGALVVGMALGLVIVTAVVKIASDRTGTQTTRPGTGSDRSTQTTPPMGAIGPVPETDYMLDLNTGEMTPLPESIVGGDYAASPDGSRLAYTQRGDNGKSQIFVANLDGTGIEQVTRDLEAAFSPAWSPDGSKIAFIGYHDGDLRDLFVLDLATGKSKQLSFSTWEPDPAEPDFSPWRSELPSFTPDGSSVVYNANRGDNIDRGEVEVRMVPVAGGESVVLMRDRSNDGTPAFYAARLSPDGSLLLYGCGDLISLCVSNVDGTDERVLVPSQGDALGGEDWSPDGSRIVYSEFHAQDVSIVDAATGAATDVAEGWSSAWLDDHTLIIQISHCYNPDTGMWGMPGCLG